LEKTRSKLYWNYKFLTTFTGDRDAIALFFIMRFKSYFNHALHIIDAFDGKMPLARFLKQYFARNKKHGATDRKMISHACYSYYRLGQALRDRSAAERLRAALFLCTEDPAKWGEVLDGESCPSFPIEDIFPWENELSEGIDHHAFCRSFLRQPDLFLRIRPGHDAGVLDKLRGQPYEFIPPFTLRLPNGFKTEDYFTPDKEIVIQDHSSQRLAPFLAPPGVQLPSPKRSVWDACAASGGKSILAYDLDPKIELTVSDIRESILHNLAQRFDQAGIKNYHPFMIDLETGNLPPGLDSTSFDLILADVPCTGSGTWGRTPEELYFFDPAKIGVYQEMQKKIIAPLVTHLGKNAFLVYSTCSVFKKENEGMAAFIKESLGLVPERMETIRGYSDGADSMFAVRFIS
jgi:16S rRNA (cytosine967-C5)-methyltransferase